MSKNQLYFASIVGLSSKKRKFSKSYEIGPYIIIEVYVFADNFQQKKPYKFKIMRKEGFTEESVKIELINSP